MASPAATHSSPTFRDDGVETRTGVVASDDLEAVKQDIAIGCRELRQHGIRNLEKRFTSIARLATATSVVELAHELLAKPPSLVRALFFDKTPDRNWFVAWHQDKTVALNRRREMAGWGPWSLKDAVHHVQPPCSVLDEMVTIRLHIDPADEDSGCLRVIPGSHRAGILTQEQVDRCVADQPGVACIAAAGDAVVMRPHVLHSSRKSRRAEHRRVVHLEYSSYELPPGITWA